jgi:hypothetical protein
MDSKPNPNPNYTRPTFTSPFPTTSNASNPSPWPSSRPNLIPTIPLSAAGRKRSRDEAAPNLSFEDEYFPTHPVIPPPENEEEWEYGEGMTLIKPNGGYLISASSQTGTWAEEKAEVNSQPTTPSPEKPMLRSHKSQRLDLSGTPAIAEEISLSNGTLVTPLSQSKNISTSMNSATEPTVDDFTRHLGIGWSRISEDEHIQAAARGWTKFIENHYPVTNVRIRLQSKGLASYLVEAQEGYFLFGEDLKQGRLVSRGLERTWENLRGSPPVFDGEVVMEAGETPKMTGMETLMNGNGATMNGTQGLASQSLEVDMDMDIS